MASIDCGCSGSGEGTPTKPGSGGGSDGGGIPTKPGAGLAAPSVLALPTLGVPYPIPTPYPVPLPVPYPIPASSGGSTYPIPTPYPPSGSSSPYPIPTPYPPSSGGSYPIPTPYPPSGGIPGGGSATPAPKGPPPPSLPAGSTPPPGPASNFTIDLKLTRQSNGLYTLSATVVSPDTCHFAQPATMGTLSNQPLPADAIGIYLPMITKQPCNGSNLLTYSMTNLRLGGTTGKNAVVAYLVIEPVNYLVNLAFVRLT